MEFLLRVLELVESAAALSMAAKLFPESGARLPPRSLLEQESVRQTASVAFPSPESRDGLLPESGPMVRFLTFQFCEELL